MIILDATTKSLELVSDSAGSAGDIAINSTWADWKSSTPAHTPGHLGSVSNGTTAVAIVAAPAASTQRQIKSICCYNAGAVAHTLTLRVNDNGTMRILGVLTLAVGASVDLGKFADNGATALISPGFDGLSPNLLAIVTKTGNATFTSSDLSKWLRLADAGAQACILPAASACTVGTKISVYNDTTVSGSSPIAHTLTRAGSDTIVGSSGSLTSLTLLSTNFVVLESDGVSKWYVRQCRFDTGWLDGGAVTITGSSSNPSKGTTSYDHIWWRRIGHDIEIRMQYKQTGAGSAGSGTYFFTIPGGFSADTNYMQVSEDIGCGGAYVQATNAQIATVTPVSGAATKFYMGVNSSASAFASVGSSNWSMASASVIFYAHPILPITGWAI